MPTPGSSSSRNPPDHYIWISWIDREGAIVSSQFSLFDHLPLVLVLLLVLQRFGLRQWGQIAELTTADHSILLHPVNEDGTLGEGELGVNFHPEDNIYSGWSLLGRATTVLGADVKGSGSGASTKEGHAESQGKTRDDATGSTVGEDPGLVKADGVNSSGTVGGGGRVRTGLDARNAYRKARDDAIKKHNLILKISWPETSRVAEWRIVAHAQTLGKTDKFIRGHIPEVKYGRDFDQYSTQHIRNFLNLQQEQAGTRTLRLIVMKRLRPIHDLDGEQFWDAFWQCFVCTCFPCKSTTPLTQSPRSLPSLG